MISSAWGGSASLGRGSALNAYASVAANNPWGIVALRSRGIKYVWSILGLVVLVALYAGPILAAFRTPAFAAPVDSLPALAVPRLPAPLLSKPKLHPLAPLPPLAASHAAGAKAQASSPQATRKAVRQKAPVVVDKHAQVEAAKKSSGAAKDPFANAPVVVDTVGMPVALPAASPAGAGSSAAAPAPPPSDSTTTPGVATRGAPTDAASYADPISKQDSAVTPAAGADQQHAFRFLSAADDTTTTAADGSTATSASSDSTAATPPDTTSATGDSALPADAGATSSTPDSTTTMSDDPASATGDSISAADAGTTPSTSGSGSGSGGADTSTSSTAATESSSPPAAPPPAGPQAAAWSIDGAHAVSAKIVSSAVVVTDGGVVTSKPISSVTSLTISGTSGADTFTLDGSLLSSGIAITFDGGGGEDVLSGPQADVSWHVDGAGGGAVGDVTFVGFEHLVGAAGNKDTFDIGPGGSVASVDGGDGGYDTLIVDGAGGAVASAVTGAQSGHVSRGGATIDYTGLEPVTLPNAATIEVNLTTSDEHVDIEDDGIVGNGVMRVRLTTGETQTITDAGSVTSLTVNASGGSNVITVHALDSQFHGALVVNGGTGDDSISLEAKSSDGAYSFDGGTGSNTIAGIVNAAECLCAHRRGRRHARLRTDGQHFVREHAEHRRGRFARRIRVRSGRRGHRDDHRLRPGRRLLRGFLQLQRQRLVQPGDQDVRARRHLDGDGAVYYTIGLGDGTAFAGVNHGALNEAGFDASDPEARRDHRRRQCRTPVVAGRVGGRERRSSRCLRGVAA